MDNTQLRNQIDTSLVGISFKQAPIANLANLVAAVVFTLYTWDFVDKHALFFWLTALLAHVLLRYVSVYVYYRMPQVKLSTTTWLSITNAFLVYIAIVWGVFAWLFIDPQHPDTITLVAVILIGLSTGAAVTLAAMRYAGYFLIVCLSVCLIGALITVNSELSRALAFLSCYVLIGNVSGLRNSHELLKRCIV